MLQPVQPNPPPQRLQRLPMVAAVVVGWRPPQVQPRPINLQLPNPHQPPGVWVEAPTAHRKRAVDNPEHLIRVPG
jgi:hypothetical protein